MTRSIKISLSQREQLRTAFLDGLRTPGHALALCCGAKATEILAGIVGAEHAERVQEWCYNALGCGGASQQTLSPEHMRLYLEKIAALTEIDYPDEFAAEGN